MLEEIEDLDDNGEPFDMDAYLENAGGVLAKPVGANVVFYPPDVGDARGGLFLESDTGGTYAVPIL